MEEPLLVQKQTIHHMKVQSLSSLMLDEQQGASPLGFQDSYVYHSY